MKHIDISWPLKKNMTSYNGRKLFTFTFFRTWGKDKARQSRVALDSHAGTHIDAPSHYVKRGKTIDKIHLDRFVGECRVLDLSKVNEKITEKNLKKFKIKKGERILLKTKNSRKSPKASFNANFVYLDRSGASYLVGAEIRSVGIDYLGIEHNQPGHETHKFLLKKDIPIIEGLRLKKVKSGRYQLLCLPLSYKNLEAAPARAILLRK
jgi:arylformamidase